MDHLFLQNKNTEITFAIQVTTKTKTHQIGEIFRDENHQPILKIYINAVPEQGKANKAIIDFLAKKWQLKKNQIKIISGAKHRIKKVHISGDSDSLRTHLAQFAPLSPSPLKTRNVD